jgi:transposase
MDLFPPHLEGGEEIAHGYKGKGSLLHLLIDGQGNPIAITTTAANGDEKKEVEKLLIGIQRLRKPSQKMAILEADKGYDAAWLRQSLFSLIPYRKMPGRQVESMQEICRIFHLERKRWMVERAIAWIKRKCRRLLLRWERIALI